MKVTVLGGTNIDITATSRTTPTTPGTSNPGRVVTGCGGVGRNIAANLARLGIGVTLLSAVDGGPLGDAVVQQTQNAGVDVSRVIRGGPQESGIYVAVHNGRGELELAVSDMDVVSRCSSSYVAANRDAIEGSRYLIIDANVPADAISLAIEIATASSVPVVAEPVSVAKAAMLAGINARVMIATPNRLEASVLAAGELVIDHLIVTRGERGVAWLPREADTAQLIRSPRTERAQTSGAGDAFVAGLVTLLSEGADMRTAIHGGIAAAGLTLTVPQTTTELMTRERLEQEIARCTSL